MLEEKSVTGFEISPCDLARFNSKVVTDEITGCWNWTSTLVWGYGKFKLQGRQWRAHRLAWAISGRELDPETVIRHKCDNKACVNPDHLLSGTQAENIQDKVDRNRQARGVRIGTRKLCPFSVLEIRKEYAETSHLDGGASTYSLADKYGVDPTIISDVVRGKTWRDVGGPITKPRAGRRRVR